MSRTLYYNKKKSGGVISTYKSKIMKLTIFENLEIIAIILLESSKAVVDHESIKFLIP